MNDRGQAYSLEGVIGAILIASALVLGLQAVSIEPWTDGGPEQGEDTRIQIEDTLDILEDEDALRTAVLCVGGDDPTTPHPGVVSTDPAVEPVGTVLNQTVSRTSNFDVNVTHPDANGDLVDTSIGPTSDPTGSAVTVTREIVLFDSDPVYRLNTSSEPPGCEIDERFEDLEDAEGATYLDNQNEDSDIFAVVQVRVVAW